LGRRLSRTTDSFLSHVLNPATVYANSLSYNDRLRSTGKKQVLSTTHPRSERIEDKKSHIFICLSLKTENSWRTKPPNSRIPRPTQTNNKMHQRCLEMAGLCEELLDMTHHPETSAWEDSLQTIVRPNDALIGCPNA
jgi:hypothetical protein